MKKLGILLCAALASVSIGCGTSSTPSASSYVARGSSDSWAPHLFTFDEKSKKSTAVSISIPTNAQYVSANRVGNEVVYCASGANGWDIFSMGLDNKETELTTGANACDPVFSPSGKLVAYEVGFLKSDSVIYTMNADGSNQKALYTPAAGTMDMWFPQFSPDGKSLVFYIQVFALSGAQSDRREAPGVHAVWPQSHNRGQQNVRGNVQTPSGTPTTSGWYMQALTDSSPTLVYATNSWWGPATFSGDGKKILMTYFDGTQDNIASVNLDGSGFTPLTTSTDAASFAPVAFGKVILFNHYNPDTAAADLYVMDTTGANQTLVSTSPNNTWQSLVDAYWAND
jgi:Tol biopolymer transport system component